MKRQTVLSVKSIIDDDDPTNTQTNKQHYQRKYNTDYKPDNDHFCVGH